MTAASSSSQSPGTATAATPRRIGYLVSLYPSTSHTFIRREVVALRKRGLAIDTFSVRPSPHPDGETFAILATSAIAIVVAVVRALVGSPLAFAKTFALALRHRVPGARALVWSLFHFVEAMVLARELRRRGIDHLHNHFANSGATVGLLTSNYLGIGWSLTLHGISETDYPAGLLLGEKVAAARFVACVSWFGRAQAMRVASPEHWHKFAIVRCGVDLAEMPVRKPRESPVRRMICVGRLSPEKGQHGLLEVMATLVERGVTDIELALVGDGPDRAALDAKVAQLGIADHVNFLGRLGEADTLAAISEADLLISPSFMEGLPVVLIEAMAIGVAVIASRVAGVPELIDDGDEGFLVTPANWREFTDTIQRVLATPDAVEKVVEMAQLKVEREFVSAVGADQIGRLFEASTRAALLAGVTNAPQRRGDAAGRWP